MLSDLQHLITTTLGDVWMANSHQLQQRHRKGHILQTVALPDPLLKIVELAQQVWCFYPQGIEAYSRGRWRKFRLPGILHDVTWTKDTFWVFRSNAKSVLFLEEYDREWRYLRTLDNPRMGCRIFYHDGLWLVGAAPHPELYRYSVTDEGSWWDVRKEDRRRQSWPIPELGSMQCCTQSDTGLWFQMGETLVVWDFRAQAWFHHKFTGPWRLCSPPGSQVIISYQTTEPRLWYPESQTFRKVRKHYRIITPGGCVDIDGNFGNLQ